MTYQEYVLVFVLGLLVAMGIGFSYETGNQHTYLLDGLRVIDPDFLQFDWFATKTTHYHDNFGSVLWLIEKLLPLSLGTVLLNTTLIVLSVQALYQLLKHCEVKKPLSALSLLVALMILTRSTSVGQSYIYSDYLQPSSIASVFFMLALVWFVKRQYLASGIFLLVCGVFHTNFLLLGLAAIGLAHLLLGKDGFVKRITLNMIPACLYLLYLLPSLLALSNNEFVEQSRYIYQHIRAPHHYIPMSYLGDFVKYFGISLLGLACGLLHLRRESPLKPLVLLFLSMLGIVIIGSALTTVVFLPFISQLFPWRLAPFSDLLAGVLVTVTIASLIDEKRQLTNLTKFLVIAGFSCALTYYIELAGYSYLIAFAVSLVSCGVVLLVIKLPLTAKLLQPSMYNPAILGLLLMVLILRLPGASQRSNFLHDLPSEKQMLFDWAKSQTSIDSQVLIPPGFGSFRLGSERAVVVDWKSSPILPDEVLIWYQRIVDVSGVEKIKFVKQANVGYAQMDVKRLAALKSKYNIDYAVFYNQDDRIKSLGKVVFENGKYLVIGL